MVSGQVAPHEIATLAAQGITVLVNNRPDCEEPGQPLARDIEDAAAASGISYHYVPIARGLGPADVKSMQDALRNAEGGKLLAFCRSGSRSALAIALARRADGEPAEDIERSLKNAGFDIGPIAHLL